MQRPEHRNACSHKRLMKAGDAFITPLLGSALYPLLCPHLKTDASAPMFDLHPHELYRATRSIVAELGMNRWTSHDLRRRRGNDAG